jgi:hypothetical protein
MIFVYGLLLVLLAGIHFLLSRRVVSLEKKYSRVAREADELLRKSSYRDGNSNRPDPYVTARRQLELALLAQKRDRLESRYVAAQKMRERVGQLRTRMKAWKGRTLPYTFGVVDVTCALALVDYLGAGQYLNARTLAHAVSTFFQR